MTEQLTGRELDAALARALGMPLVQSCTDEGCCEHLYLCDGDGTYTDLPEFHRSLDATVEHCGPLWAKGWEFSVGIEDGEAWANVFPWPKDASTSHGDTPALALARAVRAAMVAEGVGA